jgi:methionyl-tRNA synthetase
MLGFTSSLEKRGWKEVLELKFEEGKTLPKPYILFAKVEDEVIAMEIEKLHKMHEKAEDKKEPPYTPLKPEITIDDVHKLDLRVGKILKAEKLPKSKKLLLLEVDIGLETRTILSGISEHYTPEELVGKKVVIVANLKPAKLMGVESQGMILAASLDSALEVLTLQEIPTGATIS